MRYRAVGLRCALLPEELSREFGSSYRLQELLQQCGFQRSFTDVVQVARSLVGEAGYRRGARLHMAPSLFDCSSFIKWIYGQIGIWMPRRSIQQFQYGRHIEPEQLQAGDLVFTSGSHDYYLDNPSNGVGHVALATGVGTVIHAVSMRRGVQETPILSMNSNKFRGLRRVLPNQPASIWTVITSLDNEIETSEDLLWVLRIAANR